MGSLMAEIDMIGRDIQELATDVQYSAGNAHETAAVDDLAYDFSELLGELEEIRTSPVPTVEKEEKIRRRIRKLKQDVEGTRRSPRIATKEAARALTRRNVNMSAPAATNSYNRKSGRPSTASKSRRGNNVRPSRHEELSEGAYGNNRRRTYMTNNHTRNTRRSSNAPKRPLKSINQKAKNIISKANVPIVPSPDNKTRDIQLSGYMGRIQELNRHITMNSGNSELKEARKILQAKINAAFHTAAAPNVNMGAASAAVAATHPVGKAMSEILTGEAKGKSLFEQANYIVENRAKIISSTKSFEITYYKKQYKSLVDFIRNYPGNAHRDILEEAIAILSSNPAIGVTRNVNMANNNL